MKVISFSQQGPRAICILSANGVISNVTLRQPDSSGGTLTYEVWHFITPSQNIFSFVILFPDYTCMLYDALINSSNFLDLGCEILDVRMHDVCLDKIKT